MNLTYWLLALFDIAFLRAISVSNAWSRSLKGLLGSLLL